MTVLMEQSTPGIGAGHGAGSVEIRRQEALLKTGALQDAIFNSAFFSSIATDEKGVIQIFNVGAERMLGYAAVDVINRITPADISDPQELIARAATLSRELDAPITPGFAALVFKASRGIEDIYELTYIRKNGSRFPAIVSVTSLREVNGTVIGYLLIGTDNTARKQAEVARVILDQQLRDQQLYTQHLNRELEKRVLERTAELETANRELEAFSYSVSHDLRAPLRAMEGFGALLEKNYRDKIDEQGRHYLQRVRATSQRMGQLIDDLLRLSRTTRDVMERTQVDLSELANRIAMELRESAPQRKVTFTIAPGLSVDADPHLIRSVMENLIGNAWKFTSKRDGAQIELGSTAIGGIPAIFVRDNGAGFDMKYAAKLFGVFSRLHSMADYDGTGVGLANVQRIVRRHGGKVWAEAMVGRGATFFFTLAG